ncbi:hypothetical protein Voc01_092580 [Virgisporangium ochraceum]|uniref:Uncharacterized protein n=1 Tax=Virgisporangium ochraceum TaxID=65505 RepID=A0A8J4A3A1_9ACTN|nr:hypothetical protein Voc01_092580 [Virgisporangium ochraceum]
MPTSVLLAVLAAAGLLALAPALVRRYDATERLVAERAMSTARVLTRAGWQHPRRQRTCPGRRPLNPPRVLARQVAGAAAFAAGAAVFTASNAFPSSSRPAGSGPRRSPRGPTAAPSPDARRATSLSSAAARRAARLRTLRRRRRTLVLLTLVTALFTTLATLVAPGFWIGVSVTGFLLVAFVVNLRNRSLLERRHRRAEQQYEAWVERRQAAVRREQARRAAQRREMLERQLEAREEARRRLTGEGSYGRAVNE